MPDVIPTNKAIFPVSSIAFWRWRQCLSMSFLRSRRLLAERPGHIIFGLAVARLALVARQVHFRRAFLGRIGVEALAFLVALALAQPVGAGLAVRGAVGRDKTRRAPAHHDLGSRDIRQALAGVLRARVEIVDGLARALQRRQQRSGFLE